MWTHLAKAVRVPATRGPGTRAGSLWTGAVGSFLRHSLVVFLRPLVCSVTPPSEPLGSHSRVPIVPTPRHPPVVRHSGARRVALAAWLGLGLLAATALPAAEGVARAFDIPAGAAAITLKEFARQSGGQVLYLPDHLEGVRTQAVRGQLPPLVAVKRMLQGTPLHARQDATTRAISIISRGGTSKSPHAPPPTPPTGDEKSTPATSMTGKSPFSRLAGWLGLALSAFASAQSVPRDPAATPEPSVVELSPFEVSTSSDDGYAASASLGATRTNTPLVELPQSIKVFNSEFIVDVAATDTWEAVQYASNVTGGDRREDTSGGTGTSVRGYNVSRRLDGIEYAFPPTNTETYAFDRIELVKGSSSVLFGSTAPGGVINYISKKPAFKSATEVMLRYGSYDYKKAGIDTTGPLLATDNLKLAYRLVGAFEDSESVRDFEFKRSSYLAGSLEARIRGSTTVRGRLEYFLQDRSLAIGAPYLWEPSSAVPNASDGSPIVDPGYVLNLPDSFFRGEPGDFKDSESIRYEAVVEHRFSQNWVARATGSFSDWTTTRSETPILAQRNTFGVYSRRTDDRKQDRNTTTFDANVLGDLELGPTRHRLLLGYTLFDSDGNDSRWRFNLSPDFNVLAPNYGATRGPGSYAASFSESENSAFYVQDQVKTLDDRLHITVGIRRDEFEDASRNLVNGTMRSSKQSNTSPRYSVLYRINPGLSAYYAYNETFQPATNTNSDGILFEPPTTEINEVGVKLSLLENRLNGNLAVFSAELGNQFRADPVNPGEALQTSLESKGAEFDLTWTARPGWQIVAGVGYLDTEITKNDSVPGSVGNALGGAPQWNMSLWTKYKFAGGPLDGLSIGGGFTHQRERWDSDNNRYWLPDYTVVNLLVRYSWSRYDFSVNVSNVLDEDYIAQSNSARFTIFGEPRRAFATLTARW